MLVEGGELQRPVYNPTTTPIDTLLGYEQMTRTSSGSSPSIHSSSWLNFFMRSVPPSYSLMNFLIWSSSILDWRRLGEKIQMRCSGCVIA